jgi:cyclin B
MKISKFEGITSEVYSELSRNLFESEEENLPSSDYMLKQVDINCNMRAILIDWLIYIQFKLKYSGETLHLTVNFIDRYLEKVSVNRKDLQLVGVASMLIACKYEEINVPKINDLVYITDNAYVKEEVLEMECKILTVLAFNLTFVSPVRFIERYSRELNLNFKEICTAQFLLELALIDYKFIRVKPSVLAGASCFLVKFESEGKENLKFNEKVSVNILQCAGELSKAAEVIRNSSLQAVKTKYSSIEFCEVARIYKTNNFIQDF